MTVVLPPETSEYLRLRNTFDYDPSTCECGHVVLLSESDLKIESFTVSGPEYFTEEQYEAGPEWAEYQVRCISLLKECEDYHPWGVLSWMVDDKMFANWDSDHENLIAFRGVSWADIVADPATYLSAQWRSEDYFKPWKHGYTPRTD